MALRGISSPLYLANTIPKDHNFRVLFTSSVVPLAELIALRKDLANLHKVVYFHENQLVYPVQEWKTRYFQHGYNDILSCLVADKIVFNSNFNKESFFKSLQNFFNLMPDYRPKNLDEQIRPKCQVIYFPIQVSLKDFSSVNSNSISDTPQKRLHIIWPHRWEHDKDPDTFFSVIYRLKDSGEDFKLSVMGETFSENPKTFHEARKYLEGHVVNWGYMSSKDQYYRVLQEADVVVSTAIHEFFGVSMLEAVSLKCYPLCPNRLVYPEIYPVEYLYNTSNQLFKKLRYFCRRPNAVRHHIIKVNLSQFSWEKLKVQYQDILTELPN
ncbi:glycosyltransferase-like domain-containing protein 1 [Caerostris extrusa]|uniref:tRNA-queuosine alpha-mannosyltransferase n=1 Tax=Caerostris extrusa TaxID=172846 RepID=A0AAV4VSP5_CAEEX|nr:glycosyltransferase-like domain-containing protein 1 [Caerostris extrusa]